MNAFTNFVLGFLFIPLIAVSAGLLYIVISGMFEGFKKKDPGVYWVIGFFVLCIISGLITADIW